MQDHLALEWLYAHAGPVIRYRMVRDWAFPAPETPSDLLDQVLSLRETHRWLDNLGGQLVHHSRDTAAENAAAKLISFGLRAGIPAFDAKMLPYADKVNTTPWDIFSDVIAPFLITAGYSSHPNVAEWFHTRLEQLEETARRGDFEIYLPSDEAALVPKAWQGKPIYKDIYYSGNSRLPSIYDLLALTYWPSAGNAEACAIIEIIAYLCDPRFQSTPGGYLWNLVRNTCYAAGRGWLACLTEVRKVLFLELTARFTDCREKSWFKETLAEFDACATPQGTFLFPAKYLTEKRDSYHLYNGAHMGLGEDRRQPTWREIESTFWMLQIRYLMAQQA
ncbi:MAG: hypothetical protein ACYCZF_13400 [Anaerolineae bacterium]